MKQCIYCQQHKEEAEFSLEHVIPQFLGGSLVSDKFKTHDVCRQCNSNLGLFVDAAFEKDFLVFNNLNDCARTFFNPQAPSSLPLQCLGESELVPPHIEKSELCECWIGPLGELVFWVRPSDERLYWYTGGNPRTVKKQKSSAYFIFSERSLKNPNLSWMSFRDAFEGKRVKKIMCSAVSGADPKSIGFADPDSVDHDRIRFFLEKVSNGKEQKCEIKMNVAYDQRFMSKLALGLSHCLFGNGLTSTGYLEELRKGLWYRPGSDPIPKVLGSNSFSILSQNMKELLGFRSAVTVAILRVDNSILVNLNINQELNWCTQCADIGEVSSQNFLSYNGDGLCIVLFKHIGKCVEMSFPEFLSHKTRSLINPELSSIEAEILNNSGYFEGL